jgi:hypothetical protein
MVYCVPKGQGLFWRVFELEMLVYVHIIGLFGMFYGHWVSYVAIWYILRSFGVFISALVRCTKKNLATLFFPPCNEFICLLSLLTDERETHFYVFKKTWSNG